MNIMEIANALVARFNKQTAHVSPLLRDAQRSGYSRGIGDLMNALSEEAADETLRQELSGPEDANALQK